MMMRSEIISAREAIHNIPSELINLSRDGFYAIDLSFKYAFWSDGMANITGISELEVVGRSAFDAFPFLLSIGQKEVYERVLQGEEVHSPMRPFSIPESGKEGFFSADYYPYRGSSGQILGVLGIVRDQTEQKRITDLQRETESRFMKMADSSPVMLWMSGTDGYCNFFNHSWLEFSGRTMEQEMGVGWAEGVHPFDFQNCIDTYMANFRERKPFEMEYRLMRHDGQYRWILDRGAARYSPDGVFEGYIGSCTDITERKVLEEELRKTIHLREEFLSIASHELKTPLTSLGLQIHIFEHLLKERKSWEELNTQLPPMMNIAQRQLRHMADLVEKLLDISRIETGNFTMQTDLMDLAETVNEIIAQMHELARQAGCDITLSSEGPVTGHWDRPRIEQVISNLLNNAIKYAPGKPIAIHLEAANGNVVMEVEDQGPGIPVDLHQSIFEKFHRGASDRNPGGLGLGLFIVKQIVQGHGGSISVQNGAKGGTRFRVELPMSESGQKAL